MRASGPWSQAQVAAYLEQARLPARLAFAASDGCPLVASLWYRYQEGELWCATPAHARIVGLLQKEPRCGFEVSVNEPPYRGARGRGRARLDREGGDETLRALATRYLGEEPTAFRRWLLERPTPEVAIRIEIERLTSWDFGKRMTR